jgi:hypothetical protein
MAATWIRNTKTNQWRSVDAQFGAVVRLEQDEEIGYEPMPPTVTIPYCSVPSDSPAADSKCVVTVTRTDGEWTTVETQAKDVFDTGYQRNSAEGKGAYEGLPWFALDRDAKLYERGGKIHGPDNWLKGAPFGRTLQSVIRHISQYMRGDREEDHLAAARWGLAAIMTYEELISRGVLPASLDDLPKYERKENA